MNYLTTAALALVLAVSAAGANAQPTNAIGDGDHASHGVQPAPAPRPAQSGPVQSGRAVGAQGNQGIRHYTPGPGYVPPNGFVVGPQGGAGARGAGAHPGAFAPPPRGQVPGAGQPPRGRDAGRAWYNPGATPQRFQAQQRFHADWSHRPGGWYARTWVYGDFLPFGWFAPDYYLDWTGFALPSPPIGCEWVREGADAVLVDVWTGQVLSVDYGVFW